MSNLGIKEIKVPSNLNLDKQQDTLIIKGDFGQVNYEIDSRFSLDLMENGSLKFYPNSFFYNLFLFLYFWKIIFRGYLNN